MERVASIQEQGPQAHAWHPRLGRVQSTEVSVDTNIRPNQGEPSAQDVEIRWCTCVPLHRPVLTKIDALPAEKSHVIPAIPAPPVVDGDGAGKVLYESQRNTIARTHTVAKYDGVCFLVQTRRCIAFRKQQNIHLVSPHLDDDAARSRTETPQVGPFLLPPLASLSLNKVS